MPVEGALFSYLWWWIFITDIFITDICIHYFRGDMGPKHKSVTLVDGLAASTGTSRLGCQTWFDLWLTYFCNITF